MNPTHLKVGMDGLLEGHMVRVVGRATLRPSDGGRWEEYYLRMDGGRTVVLVYERGEWKWFEEYKPDTAFPAKRAAECSAGDSVNIGSDTVDVKYVGSSRVSDCEGEVLEGVRVGSRADYFNAYRDRDMVVVSWTGDEIEFYLGRKLPSYLVYRAFRIGSPNPFQQLFAGDVQPAQLFTAVVLFGLFGLVLACIFLSRPSGPATLPPTPVAHMTDLAFPIGAQGSLHGMHYTVDGVWKGEIDEIGKRFERYEYSLRDDAGNASLLVQGVAGNPRTWTLFVEVPEYSPKPATAAEFKVNTPIRLGPTIQARVATLFLSRTLSAEGSPYAEPPQSLLRYGFLATSSLGPVMVRWNDTELHAALGSPVDHADVMKAFGAAAPAVAGPKSSQ